jgi:hypothetical protein
MKFILHLMLTLISFLTFPQEKRYMLQPDNLKAEINWFIDTVKENSIGNDIYNVYVLYLYQDDEEKLCFTLGYIDNYSFYQFVAPEYFFMISDEYIIVRIDKNVQNSKLNFYHSLPELTSIKDTSSLQISQKLFPEEVGFITGITEGMIVCYSDSGNYERIFYQNSDEIPPDKSIYVEFPRGGSIELIKDGK